MTRMPFGQTGRKWRMLLRLLMALLGDGPLPWERGPDGESRFSIL